MFLDASSDQVSATLLRAGEVPHTPSMGSAVAGCFSKNKGETDVAVGANRLRVLLPFALARLGREYEVWDVGSETLKRCSGPLPLRPHVVELAAQLGCGTDFVFELVNRIVEKGPENVRASDLLKKAQGGGRGTSRLSPATSKELDAAVWEICVEQGLCPRGKAANKAIRELMLANGIAGRLPASATINSRSSSPKILNARTDAYARDHLNRICGAPDQVKGLMSVLQLDTTLFSDEDSVLYIVDQKGRIAGIANVIFGILGANRGIWTWLPFAGAANGYLAGIAIKRGLLAKEALFREMEVRGILPLHGKPAEIRHDGGPEFVNDHTGGLLVDINILVNDRSPPGTPHFRGTLERFNRTAHVLFAEFLESNEGKRYLRPIPSRPGARGILIKDLDRALADWIVTRYHLRKHSGLGGDTPMERFEKLVLGGNGLPASGLPQPLVETPQLVWDFLCEEMRVVNHTGIFLRNRRYSSPELSRLFMPGSRSSERKIAVRYNPYAMRSVFVMIPDELGVDKIVEIPWVPENGKFIMDDDDRGASINPSIWEWDALYKVQRYAGNDQPSASVVEELHARKEEEADAQKPRKGAPKKSAHRGETRNRVMRDHYGSKDIPATQASELPPAETSPADDVDLTPLQLPKSRRKSTDPIPVFLSVRDGADAY